MRLEKLILIGLVGSSLLFANQMEHKKMKPKREISKVVEIGNHASKLLLKTLGGNLKKHMKKGGPIEALHFCATNAAKLTAQVDEKLGKNVSIKRITLKPRNPANEATGDERKVLEALQTLHDAKVRLPRHLIQKTANGYKYYKPLKISKKVCLKCHGTNIDPTLKKEIAKYYPTGKATGYKFGDLRGAIVVTITKN